jgi:hypothetical protein
MGYACAHGGRDGIISPGSLDEIKRLVKLISSMPYSYLEKPFPVR